MLVANNSEENQGTSTAGVPTCGSVPFNADAIPAALRNVPQWVCWKYEKRTDSAKPTKPPINPHTGKAALSTDPATWGTFDEAVAAAKRYCLDGIGFVFTEGGGLVGVDFDDCIVDGVMNPDAEAAIKALDSYTEISPSGRGVKVFAWGSKPVEVAKNIFKNVYGCSRVEIYDTVRYFTMTGRILPGAPVTVEPRQEQITLLGSELQLAAGESKPVVKPTTPTPTPQRSLMPAEQRCQLYLGKLPDAVSGQGGHNVTLEAACTCYRFDLSDDQAWQMLQWFNVNKCKPAWTEKELRHKLTDAAAKVTGDERGRLLRESKPTMQRARADHAGIAGVFPNGIPQSGNDLEPIALGNRDPEDNKLVLSPKRTLPTAEAYVREFFTVDGRRTLQCYAGQLWEWRGNCYHASEDESHGNRLQTWLHECKRYTVKPGNPLPLLVPFESNPGTIKAALESIRHYTHLPASLVPPCWLDYSADDPPPHELLVGKSATLHIPTGQLFPPTPNLFATAALTFDYNPAAPLPELWLSFLNQLWKSDPESIVTLQDWFGYCLVQDTRQQKMLLIVGPKRSGKGTIARVLTQLVGVANVTGPTTGNLAQQFGLQPLIGKSLAIVSDARFHGEGVATAAERLLNISGEDSISIPRKYLADVNMKLPTRFMFLSNELPRFGDASGALPGRFIILRLTESFYGHEDPHLTEKLLTELPGILLWAIDGWKRLHERGYFIQPASVADAVRELEDLASPVGAFVRDCCDVGSGYRAWSDDLYKEWGAWCEREGRTLKTSAATFGRDLSSAVQGVVRRRGSSAYFYEGIGLKGAAHA